MFIVLFSQDKDLAEEFISEFESMNYTDTNFYFSLPTARISRGDIIP